MSNPIFGSYSPATLAAQHASHRAFRPSVSKVSSAVVKVSQIQDNHERTIHMHVNEAAHYAAQKTSALLQQYADAVKAEVALRAIQNNRTNTKVSSAQAYQLQQVVQRGMEIQHFLVKSSADAAAEEVMDLNDSVEAAADDPEVAAEILNEEIPGADLSPEDVEEIMQSIADSMMMESGVAEGDSEDMEKSSAANTATQYLDQMGFKVSAAVLARGGVIRYSERLEDIH